MVLVLDNYDSFTYNLVQYLGELGAEVMVVRNDAATVASIEALNPERIVISGGLVELGDTLLAPVRAAFARRIEGSAYRPRIDIVPAALGEQAGVIGAAARARDLEPGESGVWTK